MHKLSIPQAAGMPFFQPIRTTLGDGPGIGRGMPGSLEDVRFEGFSGVMVDLTEEHFDSESSEVVPTWVQSLKTLQSEVLAGNEDRLMISRSAAGT
jgi:hypothetical protein